jgi:hypothetical protein
MLTHAESQTSWTADDIQAVTRMIGQARQALADAATYRVSMASMAIGLFPVQEMPAGASAFYALRKCEECECIGEHKPQCKLGVVEDVNES